LHFWPLKNVLIEKYRFKEAEAQGLTDFLMPMLDWDPQHRATARQMLSHPWLFMPPVYETKMTEKEYRHFRLLKKLNESDHDTAAATNEEIDQNIGVLGESVDELNEADGESNHADDTSDDDEDSFHDSPTNKYGPNSPLLNVDHGPNPQFLSNGSL
jgi:serine/threonine protein kinase